MFGEMIVLGDFEAAQAQNRRCCAACLGEVGSSSKPSAAQWSRSRQVAFVGCEQSCEAGFGHRATDGSPEGVPLTTYHEQVGSDLEDLSPTIRLLPRGFEISALAKGLALRDLRLCL